MSAVFEPARLEFVGGQRRSHSSVARHRAVTVFADDRDDDAVPSQRHRAEDGDAQPDQLPGRKRCRRIVAALADEAGLGPERRRPSGDVGRLPSDAGPGKRRRVRSMLQRLFKADDHVEQQVAERAEDEFGHRRTIVPWTGNAGANACGRSCSADSSEPRPCWPRRAAAAPVRNARRAPAWLPSRTLRAIASWSSSSAPKRRARNSPVSAGFGAGCRKDPLLLSERAYLRVPLPERTRFRAVPADG